MNGTLVNKLGEYFLYMPYDSIYGPERTSASRFFKVTMSTDTENVLVATTSEEDEYIELAKLSMENCDEVASGYNLDELADKANGYLESHFIFNEGFKAGAKAILELLGDKKYSEEDLRSAIFFGQGMELWKEEEQIKNYIQSLRQNEWDVEIVMDEEKEFIFDPAMGISQGHYLDKPKLDADGCLILKRL